MDGPIWLGYRPQGGRLGLTPHHLRSNALVLGRGAWETGSLLALACREAGLQVLLVDVGGQAGRRLSGHLETYDHNALVYDAMRIGEGSALHGELVASAYATGLGLTALQEAILHTALQMVLPQGFTASPSALYEVLDGVEGFPAAAVEEVKGRLKALSPLKLFGEVDVLREALGRSALLQLGGLQPPQARDVAAGLVLAKLLVLLGEADSTGPDCLIVFGGERVFPRGRENRPSRLTTALLEAPKPWVIVSSSPQQLHPSLVEASGLRLHSGQLWNQGGRGRVLENMWVLEYTPSGLRVPFIPRIFEARGGPMGRPIEPPGEDRGLVQAILKAIESTGAATRASVAAYLSPHHPRRLVEAVIDRLEREGHISIAPVEVRPGTRIFALRLTVAGKRYLEELSGDG